MSVLLLPGLTAPDEAFARWLAKAEAIAGVRADVSHARSAWLTDHGPASRCITPEEYAREIITRRRK